MSAPSTLSIYTDGGARGNPGPAAYGFVVLKGSEVVARGGRFLGDATNNTAEYEGVLAALEWLLVNSNLLAQHQISQIEFFGDSQLVVRQLSGEYGVKQPHLQQLLSRITTALHHLNLTPTFTHIPREQNQEADRLVNCLLDASVR
jgi:ribonuclease HI